MARHEINLSLIQATDTRSPITASLTVTASDGEVLHAYDMSEHDFVRLLRGGVIRADDEMSTAKDGE